MSCVVHQKCVSCMFRVCVNVNDLMAAGLQCHDTHPGTVAHPREDHIGAIITVKPCLTERQRHTPQSKNNLKNVLMISQMSING